MARSGAGTRGKERKAGARNFLYFLRMNSDLESLVCRERDGNMKDAIRRWKDTLLGIGGSDVFDADGTPDTPTIGMLVYGKSVRYNSARLISPNAEQTLFDRRS